MRFFPRGAAALAVAALVPVMAAAQQPAPQRPMQPGQQRPQQRQQRPQPRDQRPQLTEQQREQLRAFDEQHRQALETSRRELGDLHRQLDEALTAAQLDQSKINSLRSSIVQKETALAQARVDRLAKLSSLLTAEQRQAFRGRGLGQAFGPGGGRGMMQPGGGRGGAMMGQPGQRGGRGMAGRGGPVMQRRQGLARQQQQRQRRGGQDLREEIRRLEMQIEALRRRIR